MVDGMNGDDEGAVTGISWLKLGKDDGAMTAGMVVVTGIAVGITTGIP